MTLNKPFYPPSGLASFGRSVRRMVNGSVAPLE
jgi:hypothetical protein